MLLSLWPDFFHFVRVTSIKWTFTVFLADLTATFLPRDCMQCNAQYSMSQMSVRLYVKRVNALTKRKKIVPTFLYRIKDHSS